ncbi:MAG TPA: hypothetical protein VNO21_15465 [Polyangiaceae bacterium]|nr:hypothetical protein [Polyangiaceae bacterium]
MNDARASPGRRRLAAMSGVLAGFMVAVACHDFDGLFTGSDAGTPGTPIASDGAPAACSSGQVPCEEDVVQMAAGANHVCAVLRNGSLYCWGSNTFGQLGRGIGGAPSNQPQLVVRADDGSTVGDIVDLALGRAHTCVVRSTGTMLCWGAGAHGQVPGVGPRDDGMPLDIDLPHRVDAFPIGCCEGCCADALSFIAVAKGPSADHGCAIASDGRPYCWGYNQHEQLGYTDGGTLVPCDDNGPTTATCSSALFPPTLPPDAGTVGTIAVGGSFTCAIDGHGGVLCGGDDSSGQLANGHYVGVPSEFPFDAVTGLPNGLAVQAIASGDISSCAVLTDGSVWCWGDNDAQQLGHARGPDAGDVCCGVEPCGPFVHYCSPRAVRVAGLGNVASVGVGSSHACAVQKDGTVWCWGANEMSQLGSASAGGPMPRRVSGVTDAIGIAVGDNHSCVWKGDGTAACWGLNDQGQLAHGITNSDTPVPVLGLPR